MVLRIIQHPAQFALCQAWHNANRRAFPRESANFMLPIWKPAVVSALSTVSMTAACLTGNQVSVGGGASTRASSSRVTSRAPQCVRRVDVATVVLLSEQCCEESNARTTMAPARATVERARNVHNPGGCHVTGS